MLTRIKISLFEPSKIGYFFRDSLVRVFLYLLLAVFLATLPGAVRILSMTTLDSSLRTDVRTLIVQSDDIPSCVIENYTLQACETYTFDYNQFLVVIHPDTPPNVLDRVVVVLDEEGLTGYLAGQEMLKYTYQDIDLEALDFASLALGDDRLQYDRLFHSIEILMQDTKPIWAPALIVANYIFFFLYYGLIVLFVAFIYRSNKIQIPFKFRFKLAVYSSTILFIGIMVTELYGLDFMLLLLLFLPYVFMHKAVNGIPKFSGRGE